MLQIWDVNWYLDVEQCPCDVHFMDWIEETGVKGATIFHFGTGGHHHVGLRNLARGAPNAILGITASPDEHQEFIKLAIENPTLSRNYVTCFGDIYLLNPKLLPRIDIATLFHLHEFRGDSQDAYGGLTDRQVTEVLLDVMPAGGRIVLYSGSFAADQAIKTAQSLCDEGRLAREGEYKSLIMYRKLQ